MSSLLGPKIKMGAIFDFLLHATDFTFINYGRNFYKEIRQYQKQLWLQNQNKINIKIINNIKSWPFNSFLSCYYRYYFLMRRFLQLVIGPRIIYHNLSSVFIPICLSSFPRYLTDLRALIVPVKSWHIFPLRHENTLQPG